MKLSVTNDHLDRAIVACEFTNDYMQKCILAQAFQDVYGPGSFGAKIFTVYDDKRDSYEVTDPTQAKELWTLFDEKNYKKLRTLLPVELEYNLMEMK